MSLFRSVRFTAVPACTFCDRCYQSRFAPLTAVAWEAFTAVNRGCLRIASICPVGILRRERRKQ